MVVEQLQRAGIDARSIPVENSVFLGRSPAIRRLRDVLQLAILRVRERAVVLDGPLHRCGCRAGRRALARLQQLPRAWNSEGAAAYSAIVDAMATMPLGDPTVPGMVGRSLPVSRCRDAFHPPRGKAFSSGRSTRTTGRAGPSERQLLTITLLSLGNSGHPRVYPHNLTFRGETERVRWRRLHEARAACSPREPPTADARGFVGPVPCRNCLPKKRPPVPEWRVSPPHERRQSLQATSRTASAVTVSLLTGIQYAGDADLGSSRRLRPPVDPVGRI